MFSSLIWAFRQGVDIQFWKFISKSTFFNFEILKMIKPRFIIFENFNFLSYYVLAEISNLGDFTYNNKPARASRSIRLVGAEMLLCDVRTSHLCYAWWGLCACMLLLCVGFVCDDNAELVRSSTHIRTLELLRTFLYYIIKARHAFGILLWSWYIHWYCPLSNWFRRVCAPRQQARVQSCVRDIYIYPLK